MAPHLASLLCCHVVITFYSLRQININNESKRGSFQAQWPFYAMQYLQSAGKTEGVEVPSLPG